MINMNLIGLSKVSNQKKVTLVEPVAEILGTNPGDYVVFLQASNGDIIIKKRTDIKINKI
jgi:bifunctional DNA-binding transcriptional regulator/antitoxin component of YhaV-PrlF toxin-antitoxin module